METKRVFLALPLEPVEPAVETAICLKQLLKKYRIRWVDKDNYHLTLFFFGDVPVSKLAELKSSLHSVTDASPVFNFRITAPGMFRKGREPRVLWLGIEAPVELYELKRKIDEAVAVLGFPSDGRDLKPHLTLGRFQPEQTISPELGEKLSSVGNAEQISYEASRLILFESKLTPTGAKYIPLEEFRLVR